jgi:hypothetical protein
MADIIVCPVCGTEHKERFVFCPECGCSLSEAEAVSITINPNSGSSIAESVKNQVQSIGQKAQQGISGVTTAISDKARAVSSRASNIVVQEKVTEAMGNLVNLMINVSKDITKQVPVDMVGAIDLEAEVNFVAFTIGVSIDLAELNKSKKADKAVPEV